MPDRQYSSLNAADIMVAVRTRTRVGLLLAEGPERLEAA